MDMNHHQNPGWSVTFRVFRLKTDQSAHYDTFTLDVNPDEYVIDAVERIWAYHDRSLAFAHACHHSTCGACGMRVNGVEKLTCITPIHTIAKNGGLVQVDPLRNFPIVSDLVVDMGPLFRKMEVIGHRSVLPLSEEPAGMPVRKANGNEYIRLSDCIECGLCISACPVAASTPDYLGPAVLAGALQHGIKGQAGIMRLVDSEDGVWRCHSAFECTRACPSYVEPGTKIMQLRRQVVGERFANLFRSNR
jgi:succinate dehydrogenase / fumarate reductase iron-sulfur subunit